MYDSTQLVLPFVVIRAAHHGNHGHMATPELGSQREEMWGGWGVWGKATSFSLCMTDSESQQADPRYFFMCSFLTSKMSVCRKLFITVWWWKCFGSDLGRGGSTGQ